MSRSNQIVTQFPALDHEPRGNGPPPSYRNSAATEDSWSTASGSSQAMAGKRRSSWNNLVQVGGDPMIPKQAPPRPEMPKRIPTTTTFSVGSRTSSEAAIPTTIYHSQFTAHGQAMAMQKVYSNEPRLVSAPRPAGTIQTTSVAPSRTGSVLTGINPSPPISHKKQKNSSTSTLKRNRLQEFFKFLSNKRTVGCCLFLLVALVIAAIIAIVLSQVLPNPKEATFNWVAPSSLTNGQNVSSTILMKVNKERVRFQMTGAAPMKGNFVNYYDFNMNHAVIIDQSLQVNGKNLYCFIVPIDRSTMPNPSQVRKAARNSIVRHQQTEGWQEQWSWIPSPVQTTNSPSNVFNPPIPECNGSRIVQLQPTSDQKNRRCTDCYDFCLPDYGIMKDVQNNNEEYLNIVRRTCFYLFVPEWRTYAQAKSIEQNQMDFENYYRNRQHLQVSYGDNGPNSSRWIPLNGVSRNVMMNTTGSMIGQIGGAINQYGRTAYGAIMGQQPQNPQQQQQQSNQNGVYNVNSNFGNYGINPNQPPNQSQQNGYHPAAVNGVVNLNGVNGNNQNSEYNTNSMINNQQQQSNIQRNLGYGGYGSNVNSGYSNPQSQLSSGNTNGYPEMNGFGAAPTYSHTSQNGQNGQIAQNARVGQMGQMGQMGQNGPNNQQASNNNNNQLGPRIGSVLNEFGNPVTINATPSPPQQSNPTYPIIGNPSVSYTAQDLNSQLIMNRLQNQLQQSNQNGNLMGNQNGMNQIQNGNNNGRYQPDVQQLNYNIPNYQQLRPDALSRQGRIYKQ